MLTEILRIVLKRIYETFVYETFVLIFIASFILIMWIITRLKLLIEESPRTLVTSVMS